MGVEKVGVETKQPNSGIRKCVRVQLKKNNKRITAFVPRDGGMSFCDENDEVLGKGFGRSGHSVVTCPACVSSSPRLLVAVSSHSGPTRRRRCQSDSTLLHNEYNQASRADRRPQPAQ